jgi:putative ubiquitin-RnfH superfamily antitoxin RatB of RatAB toxin-antitoxin module
MADWIDVEVAAGDARKQVLVALTLTDGATAADAVRAAGLAERLPGLVVDEGSLGVFGKRCRPDQVLEDGDRVEVYQPLKADPKVVRRELAEMERAKKKAKAG